MSTGVSELWRIIRKRQCLLMIVAFATVALAVTAACGDDTEEASSAAAAEPEPEQEQEQEQEAAPPPQPEPVEDEVDALAVVDEVVKHAEALIEESGCPLLFSKADFAGPVTEANREDVAEIIVQTTATVMASDFQCTDVVTLDEAQELQLLTGEDVAKYRAQIVTFVEAGDLLVTVTWSRTTDGLRIDTLALVDDATGLLRYEPMISSWASPGPSPGPAASPERGSAWRWTPWPRGRVIADTAFGLIDLVRKKPTMFVDFDEAGIVLGHSADAQESTKLFYTAVVTQRTQQIPATISGESGVCWRWFFRVHWAAPLVKITAKAGIDEFDFGVEFGGIGAKGTDLEGFQLCWNGDGTLLVD